MIKTYELDLSVVGLNVISINNNNKESIVASFDDHDKAEDFLNKKITELKAVQSND